MDQIEIQIPRTKVQEGSSFTATAYFRDRGTSAADTPTTTEYRIDCLSTKSEVLGWTTLSPATSIEITIQSTYNDIISNNIAELKQLTVAANRGLSTQVVNKVNYWVEGVYGV